MLTVLANTPLLLFALVAAVGTIVGRIEVRGTSLGVAAVLFAGLFFGALDPRLKLPELTVGLGLALVVYTLGLSSGASFFASFGRKSLRENALVVGVLALAAALTAGLAAVFGLPAPMAAGLYAGSLTNTPALAGVLEYLSVNAPAGAAATEPVVGYSIAYPVGVIGVIAAIALAQRLWRVDYAREADALRAASASSPVLDNRTVRVTQAAGLDVPIADLVRAHGWDVLFGRIERGGDQHLARPDDRFRAGDLVGIVGTREAVERAAAVLGEVVPETHLEHRRSAYDYRRIFVSSPDVVGKRLADLGLTARFGALVTRVRRGDVEWVAHGDTVLDPGDRVRVVARPDVMPEVTRFFGDSYRALSEIDLLPFSLGLALGLLLGLVPVPLLGGVTFRLGLAGGPLIVGLILGKLGRTGPLVWHLPYSGNLLLRQFGLVLFFAGVGTRSGDAFVSTLRQSGGLEIFAAGAAVTLVSTLLTLWLGHRVLRLPMSRVTGLVAGQQTQPAVLTYALDTARTDAPALGYATVFPLAAIVKILFAQLLLALML